MAIGVVVELGLPLPEERLGDVLHVRDSLVDGLRLLLAALEFRIEPLVGLLQFAAFKAHQGGELLQGGLELLLRLLLGVPGVLHAIDQQVPLVIAELLHGRVVGALAAPQDRQPAQNRHDLQRNRFILFTLQ